MTEIPGSTLPRCLGIEFGDVGGGVTELKLFWKYFGNRYVHESSRCGGVVGFVFVACTGYKEHSLG